MSTSEGPGAGAPSYRPGNQWKRSMRRREAAKRPKRKPFLPDFLPLDKRMMLSTFTVTDTSDSASDPNSLRSAITQSNASGPGPNTIDFNIPTSDTGYNATTGIWTIGVTSQLPEISVPVTMDGTSQSGYTSAPLVDLDGTNAGADASGLVLSEFSTIKALVINNFASAGILLDSDANTIDGCYIGTNAAGTAAGSQSMNVGIDVLGAFNTIGGVTSTRGSGSGNVISGAQTAGVQIDQFSNATIVIGNAIGTNASGTAAVPNGTGILSVNHSGSATIGGTTAGTANLISGNTNAGIEVTGAFAGVQTIEGNLIGTDVTGTLAIPNDDGVEIDTGAGATEVGGSVAGAGNVISGNLNAGVEISDASFNNVWGNVIGLNLAENATLGNFYGVRIDADAANNTIGGRELSFGTTVEQGFANVISGNNVSVNSVGVIIVGSATDNLVPGNFIGTDITGTVTFPNTVGVEIGGGATDNTIGGGILGATNVISGNSDQGVILTDSGTTGNVLADNLIGTDITGKIAIPNGADGIQIESSASGNTIGGATTDLANEISGNTAFGVEADSATAGNFVANDYLGTGPGGSGSLPNGGVGLVIDSSATVLAQGVLAGNVENEGTLGVAGSPNAIAIGGDFTQTGAAVLDINLGGPFAQYYDKLEVSGTATLAGALDISLINGDTIGSLDAFDVLSFGTISGSFSTYSYPPSETLYPTYGPTALILSATSSVQLVTTTADSGKDSLRHAITTANALAPAATLIAFDIPSSDPGYSAGVWTITLSALLPSIATQVGVDASTQPTYSGTPVIQLDAGGFATGIDLAVGSDSSVVRALVVNAFTTSGISIESNFNLIQSCYVGTNTAGDSGSGNGADIYINGTASVAERNTIGGTLLGAGNLLSGMTTGEGIDIQGNSAGTTVIEGNRIGTTADGTAPLSNNEGILVWFGAGQITIGGAAAGAGNVISGNTYAGIDFDQSSDNDVVGNLIGTDPTGTIAVGSTSYDIYIYDASGNTIGGLASTAGTGAGNIISGALSFGVAISQDDTADGNLVEGNLIGYSSGGSTTLANPDGVGIAASDAPNTIGGTAAGAANVISGNTAAGIFLSGTSNSLITGNLIGTDVTGELAVGNFGYGIELDNSSNNVIGGSGPGALNVISNTQFSDPNDSIGGAGIVMQFDSNGNALTGNYIGTDLSGTVAMGNVADGVDIESGSSSNTIGGSVAGTGNVISNNVNGVDISGSGTSENFVQGNLIGTDSTGSVAQGNATGVVITFFATDNTIGGVTATPGTGAGNVISASIGYGITIDDSAGDNAVQGDLIGTGSVNSISLGNGFGGVALFQAGAGNTIGGDVSGAGNLISGNAGDGIYDQNDSGNLFEGNVIGLDSTGTTAVANDGDGVELQRVSGDTVGGTVAAARNIISGNTTNGIELDGANTTGNLIEGNYIGTDSTGATAFDSSGDPIGNVEDGVEIDSAANGNTIGGATPAARNIISGNMNFGVHITGPGTSDNLVEGNSIGLNLTESATVDQAGKGLGNVAGVYIESGAGDNTIGGTSAATANVISGNSTVGVYIFSDNGFVTSGNVVEGNLIGTDSTGTVSFENDQEPGGEQGNGLVIQAGNDNTIGGTVSGSGNVISGNTQYGIQIFQNGGGTNDNLVEGNMIGTDITGTTVFDASGNPLGNGSSGISLVSSSGNTIGGSVAGSANVLSGNFDGVEIGGSSGDIVLGNFIGTNLGGTSGIDSLGKSLGNTTDGVLLVDASMNIIGGTTPGSGNVISGNASNGIDIYNSANQNTVEGNEIGTNAAGTAAIPNGNDGVYIEVNSSLNTIGGPTAAARNLISGNQNAGVEIDADQNLVEGDFIGTDTTGSNPVSNADGVIVNSSSDTIGGTSTGAGNLISGNTSNGIFTTSAGTDVLIAGNMIGTDITGKLSVRNGYGTSITSIGGVSIGGTGATIGGTVAGAGNLISGNYALYGLKLASTGSLVVGNMIGTDVTGTSIVANYSGIYVVSGPNTIGGATQAAENLISGNEIGIEFQGSTASGNIVEGNLIGPDHTGAVSLGNDIGVYLAVGASNNTLGGDSAGQGNVVSSNNIGVELNPGGSQQVSDNLISGNKIGTDPTGTLPLGNLVGVDIFGLVTGTTIGGTTAAAANVISASRSDGIDIIGSSAAGNLVIGNLIGTDVTGATAFDPTSTHALGNSADGISISSSAEGNTIGGTAFGMRNIISGNQSDGVEISGSGTTGNVVVGNYIGTNVTGTSAVDSGGNPLGNANDGVEIDSSAAGNTIGGTASGAANLISGNQHDGVEIAANDNLVEGDFIGTDVTGTTVFDSSHNPIGNVICGIELDSGATGNTIGGSVTAARNLISGNVGDGVEIVGSGTKGNLVEGDYIGTDVTGTVALPNEFGVVITSGVFLNTIGGPAAGAGNLISGNTKYGVVISGFSTENLVAGNQIGTDSTGTVALGNGIAGVKIYAGSRTNTIGGTTSGAGNLISGNIDDGITVGPWAKDNIIEGNKIGTDTTGTVALGNGQYGVFLDGGYPASSGGSSETSKTNRPFTSGSFSSETWGGNVVGDSGAGAGNVISGNGAGGIFIAGGTLDIVAGNFIGTDVSGTIALPNAGDGVEVVDAIGTTIGGTVSGDSNVISGNTNYGIDLNGAGTTGTLIAGNKIGTDVTGTVALPNFEGVDIASGASGNTIGGVASAANLISGNQNAGVDIEAGTTGNFVAGNQIGTDITGTVAVSNTEGIFVAGTDNTIGGTSAGEGNLISGNAFGIQFESPSTANIVEGNLIGTDTTGTFAVPNGYGIFFAQAGGDTIGGTAADAANVISGNSSAGVWLARAGSTGIFVEGNLIGTDITGTKPLPNDIGVLLNQGARDNTIGGTEPGARNVISGNTGDGVEISEGETSGNVVAGNKIGTDVTGTIAIFNGTGIEIDTDASGNTIGGTAAGAGNTIAFNTGDAIDVVIGTGNAILRNFIFSNGSGIVLTSDGNDDQIAPVITHVTSEAAVATAVETTIAVDLAAAGFISGSTYSLDFFASAPGDPASGVEAHIYIGTQTFLGGTTGNVTFMSLASPLTPTQTVTATATLLAGSTFTDTSAFSSPAVVVTELSDYIVTTTAATGAGSLEQAILDANAATSDPNAYIILFGITMGSAPYTINPLAAGFTPITHAVVLDATSQPGYAGSPIIVLDGTGVTTSGLVLDTGSDGSAIRGFDIIDFTAAGTAGIEIDSGSNVVQANYVGVQTDGFDIGENTLGVLVQGANNTIGGATPGTANVISANNNGGVEIAGAGASANVLAGNMIGPDKTGTVEIGNGGDDVEIDGAASGNTIGGATAGAGNVIDLSLNAGVELSGVGTSGNVVAGNLIGTDITGTIDFSNEFYGVEIDAGASGNVIGGTTALLRNIISGNGAGVSIANAGNGNVVEGDFIGTDVTGTIALPNGGLAVLISSAGGATIGGTAAGAGNLISGNNQGEVYIDSSNDLVAGTLIGTDITGTVALPNEDGVEVNGSGDTIGGTAAGAGNLISANIEDGILIDAGSNLVEGNRIGTDVTGTVALANRFGVFVEGPSNTIGGTTAGAANLISGNTLFGVEIFDVSRNLVEGNLIGTDSTGTVAVANGSAGVEIAFGATGNTIGGTASGTKNVISGNTSDGVEITGAGTTGNVVAGNFIGTDVSGTISVGNGTGVEIDSAAMGNTIGGDSSGARNLISGNIGDGVDILGAGTTDNLVAGNMIGTDITGLVAVSNTNNTNGVLIEQGASDNTIGGTTSSLSNLISGNYESNVGISGTGTTGNVVAGDMIGVDSTGVSALEFAVGVNMEESSAGITIKAGATGNTIGGTASGAGSVISGDEAGVYVTDTGTTGNLIAGNRIGTDSTGTIAVPDSFVGVELATGSSGNTVGGTTSGASNLISGNDVVQADGLDINASADNLIEGNKIGTNSSGTAALRNDGYGVDVGNSSGNTIGGTVAGAANLLSGNYAGIALGGAGTTGTVVVGNLIGTDVTGELSVGNYIGVEIADSASGNLIGGTTPGTQNVISGNDYIGVSIGPSGTGNVVEGNLIGTDSTGSAALSNYGGIALSSSGNTIGGTVSGAGNTIAFNGYYGVELFTGAVADPILENLIYSNGPGIVLNSGANDNQAAPVITAATSQSLGATSVRTTVSVDLTGAGFTAGDTYSVDFFASAIGDPTTGVQARVYLGTQTFIG